MEGLLVAVQVLDEGRDPSLVLEAVLLAVPLVLQQDEDAAVQEGELAQALGQGVEAEGRRLEDLGVGLEADLGPALVGDARVLEGALGRPALVALAVDLLVPPDLHLQRLAQGVDHGDAHAVQAARHLVGLLVELAARVQLGEHHLGRVHAHDRRVGTDGYATAVVHHRHRVVDVDRDADLGAVAGQRLVDRVVDNLEDEVVQAGAVGGVADVHAGALAHPFQAFEDLDRPFTVSGVLGQGIRTLGFAHVFVQRGPRGARASI